MTLRTSKELNFYAYSKYVKSIKFNVPIRFYEPDKISQFLEKGRKNPKHQIVLM